MRASSGFIVAYGKFAALPRSNRENKLGGLGRKKRNAPVLERALKKEDFPTFGNPECVYIKFVSADEAGGSRTHLRCRS